MAAPKGLYDQLICSLMPVQHYRSLDAIALQNAWLTIGSFDGVHLGHQAIIQKLTAGAHSEDAPAVVLTFDPHPKKILYPDLEIRYLTTPDEKAARLGNLGVDVVISHPFNAAVASMSAREFLDQLKIHLGLRHFWVGHDFAMGRNREGNIELLQQLGAEMAYELQVVAPVDQDGKVVSSSRIRELIGAGEISQANRLLGYEYPLYGEVVTGAQRGRTIGIPTANLTVPDNRVLPAIGVYACRARVNGRVWQAVTNVGRRPTFETGVPALSIEAHLLDFEADIYGRNVELDFVAYLRGEQRFSGIDALKQQIQADILQAREILV